MGCKVGHKQSLQSGIGPRTQDRELVHKHTHLIACRQKQISILHGVPPTVLSTFTLGFFRCIYTFLLTYLYWYLINTIFCYKQLTNMQLHNTIAHNFFTNDYISLINFIDSTYSTNGNLDSINESPLIRFINGDYHRYNNRY